MGREEGRKWEEWDGEDIKKKLEQDLGGAQARGGGLQERRRKRVSPGKTRENACGRYGCKSAYETYIKDLQEQIRAGARAARRYPWDSNEDKYL